MYTLAKFAPLVLAAGCAAVGPDYTRPYVPMQASFVGGTQTASDAVETRAWWRQYDDAMLTELVDAALARNLDVATAQEAIKQAQAQAAQTGLASAVSSTAQGESTRSGGDGQVSTWTHSAGLSAGVVLDIFGGLRRSQEAAKANVDAAYSNVQVERLAVLAEVIAQYADARTYQAALQLTRQSIRTREETLSATRTAMSVGASTRLDEAQAQAALDSAKADIPSYLASFRAAVFSLATLTGQPAGPLMERMQRGAPQLKVPGSVATGMPADLLRTRPDVRYYEAVLHQQTALVGVAEADLYPSLSLSGSLSQTAGVQGWSFGPAISWGFLEQTQLRAAKQAQVSEAKQAELTWRQSILGAVEDVQVAQSNLEQYRAQTSALRRASNSYDTALDLSRENYRNGAETLLDLLDTDRSAASARISVASAQNNAAQAWAVMQIAIGAGAALGAPSS